MSVRGYRLICEVRLDNNDVSQILCPSKPALELDELIEIHEWNAVDDCRRGYGCFSGGGVAFPIKSRVDFHHPFFEKDLAIALCLFPFARRAQRGAEIGGDGDVDPSLHAAQAGP